MAQDRKSIAAKIRALFSKTVAKGATEAEAAAACAKAKELLDTYQISMSALELEQEGTEQVELEEQKLKRGDFDIRARLCWKVAEFCEVKAWVTGRTQIPVFFGLKSDTDFAVWLIETLESFVKKEADRYALDSMLDSIWSGDPLDVRPASDRNGFKAGCIDRIKERLSFEAAKRKDQHRGQDSTNQLIIAKSAIVTREFNKLGMTFGRASGPRGTYSGGAGYSAGKAAGDRASFGRPVNGGSRPLRIGKN